MPNDPRIEYGNVIDIGEEASSCQTIFDSRNVEFCPYLFNSIISMIGIT